MSTKSKASSNSDVDLSSAIRAARATWQNRGLITPTSTLSAHFAGSTPGNSVVGSTTSTKRTPVRISSSVYSSVGKNSVRTHVSTFSVPSAAFPVSRAVSAAATPTTSIRSARSVPAPPPEPSQPCPPPPVEEIIAPAAGTHQVDGANAPSEPTGEFEIQYVTDCSPPEAMNGSTIGPNDGSYKIAYNMLTGIRHTVSRIEAQGYHTVINSDFDHCTKDSFDVMGTQLTPGAQYDFKFKDYAPRVFQSLREYFHVDPSDYLMSLTSKYILSELSTPGKSGSFFYFSSDYKYIIKTVRHSEHKFLRKILPFYYRHVDKNRDTLLSQFYGLHRVKTPFGRKIHFVVMNNIFPAHRDTHKMFDLKGSLLGRYVPDIANRDLTVQKDQNWLEQSMAIELGPTKQRFFLHQLGEDVKLLEMLGIMDYSLLIGVHDVERGNKEQLRKQALTVFQAEDENGMANSNMNDHQGLLQRQFTSTDLARDAQYLRQKLDNQHPRKMKFNGADSDMPDELPFKDLLTTRQYFFTADDGGIQATYEDDSPADKVYYVGIIDCLTRYGPIKKAENWFKGLMADASQLSAVPPQEYGNRFLKFITEACKCNKKPSGSSDSPRNSHRPSKKASSTRSH